MKFDDVNTPSLLLVETANASIPTPAAGQARLFRDTDDLLKFKDQTGTVTLVGSGIAASTVDAKGDLIAATADNTVARLAVGSNGQVLVADSGQSTGLKYVTRKRSVNFLIDGGGSVIATGIKGDVRIPFAGTIVGVTLLADQSGSIAIDIWKDTYANFPPVDADSITASAVPTISSATKSEDTTLTGWTTSIAAGDILRFNVDSATTITRVTLVLEINETS